MAVRFKLHHQWNLARRAAVYDLGFIKKLDISLPWVNAHPTAQEFRKVFTARAALASNPECEVNVKYIYENWKDHDSEIKVEYENGVVDVLNHRQPLDSLLKEFLERRERLQFFSEIEKALQQDEDDNPFLTQEVLSEGQQKKEQKKSTPAAPPKPAKKK